MLQDDDRVKASLVRRSATPSPKLNRVGRYLKPRKTEFVEESVYSSQQGQGLILQNKSEMLQSRAFALKAENRQLKLDLLHTQNKLQHQSRRTSLDLASANAGLREFKLLMQTRELDFQKEVLGHNAVLARYQRALIDSAHLLVNVVSHAPDCSDLARQSLEGLTAISSRVTGRELDSAITQLKGVCVFTMEEFLHYISPSSSDKELLNTAKFNESDVAVE